MTTESQRTERLDGPGRGGRRSGTGGLFGRGRELERIDELLDGARLGRSGVLTVVGPAGAGKSALLEAARARGGDMTVISAHGSETESDLPYAGLAELLRPVIDQRAALPAVQRAALESALALGPPDAHAGFALYAGVLSILAAVAEPGPVLVTVDDCQWLDEESLQALLFSARRLRAEGIAILFATRPGGAPALDACGFAAVPVEGLDPEAAMELLRAMHGDALAQPTAELLVATAAGNPLALVELPRVLSPGQLNGREPIAGPLPTGARLGARFERSVRGLGARTRQALAALAASERCDLPFLEQVLAALGLDPSDLEPAEMAGIVRLRDGQAEFAHPLWRSAAYHGARESRRRRAHAAIAACLDPERPEWPWHRAAAALGRDAEAAEALDRAGADAIARAAHVSAAHAFERAAGLGDGDERARRLLAAAEQRVIAGHPDRALDLLATARRTAGDVLLRSDIERLHGHVRARLGEPGAALAALAHAAAAVEPHDTRRAASLHLEIAVAQMITGDIPGLVLSGRRAAALGDAATGSLANLIVGAGLIAYGEGDRGDELIAGEESFVLATDITSAPIEVLGMAGQSSLWTERFDRAERILGRLVAAARGRSAVGLLPYPLAALAHCRFRRGEWREAYADAAEAVQLAQDTAQEPILAFALATLALIEAGRGDAGADATARRALELARRTGGTAILPYVDRALGLRELGEGDAGAAIEHLERLRASVRALGADEPGQFLWHADLAEGYIRRGDAAAALDVIRELECLGAPWRRWAEAAAARCRGLLADDADFESHFEVALTAHDAVPMPFERARTLLALGERRRRARRRASAREPLRDALTTFQDLGATSWAERARTELRASGIMARRRRDVARDELTAHELRVAMMVARGMTNREVATALFLSPKTIEYHLGLIYRKLGVRSRTELAGVLARARRDTDPQPVP